MNTMDYKKIFVIALVSVMLLSTAYAAKSVTDFKVDKSLEKAETESNFFVLYLNKDKNSGIAIYPNADDDSHHHDDDKENHDNHLVHDEGREYIVVDDDMNITKNNDSTGHFEDYDHGTHGVVELVKSEGNEFIVISFAKNSSNVKDSDLTKALTAFNKDNILLL